jgi:chromosome segregation ATPase
VARALLECEEHDFRSLLPQFEAELSGARVNLRGRQRAQFAHRWIGEAVNRARHLLRFASEPARSHVQRMRASYEAKLRCDAQEADSKARFQGRIAELDAKLVAMDSQTDSLRGALTQLEQEDAAVEEVIGDAARAAATAAGAAGEPPRQPSDEQLGNADDGVRAHPTLHPIRWVAWGCAEVGL